MTKRYYLAYGSNLNQGQMQWRCRGAVPLGTAEIKNYRLLFKGSQTGAHLTIEEEPGCSVPVAVWAVTAADEARLDRYEGFPRFYYKKELEITYKGISSGKKLRVAAFVYIMHEDRPLGIPTQHYMDVCRKGYKDFGFDESILRTTLANSMEGMG